jgi:hypothetical protein
MKSFVSAVLSLMIASLSGEARTQTAPAVEAAVTAILANPRVVKTLEDIKADDGLTLAEQKRITEIPAPPCKEKARAEYYLKRFQELGFKDASIDTEGNVIGLRKGSGGGPKLVVSAHLDTVFPEGKDPGGHSFQEFGLPSAIHAMGRAIAKISELQTPPEPKTTFTVGTVVTRRP